MASGQSPTPPTIHKAERTTDGSGAVEWWDALDESEAVAWRKQGLNIVVRGSDKKSNKEKAKGIETAVGFWKFHVPHARAGSQSLPHFQQASDSPKGHSWFEVDNRKAVRKK